MSPVYVNLLGSVGLLAFWYFSYRWIQRKRLEDPLPPWLRKKKACALTRRSRHRLRRQHGVIDGENSETERSVDLVAALLAEAGEESVTEDTEREDTEEEREDEEEENEARTPEVNPIDAEGLSGLAREACEALKKALRRHRFLWQRRQRARMLQHNGPQQFHHAAGFCRVHGLRGFQVSVWLLLTLLWSTGNGVSVRCTYHGTDINITSNTTSMNCQLNCTCNNTQIYNGPCVGTEARLPLNVTFNQSRRQWHSVMLKFGFQYHLEGWFPLRVLNESRETNVTEVRGEIACFTNDTNVTVGQLMLNFTGHSYVLQAVAHTSPFESYVHWEETNVTSNVTSLENTTTVMLILTKYAESDYIFLQDMCPRFLRRTLRLTKNKKRNSTFTGTNVTSLPMWTPECEGWKYWITLSTMWRNRRSALLRAKSRALGHWALLSICTVAAGSIALLSLFCILLIGLRRDLLEDFRYICRDEGGSSTKNDVHRIV
ncbi:envelope glycoprotein UL37 [Human betaherpesvirus 5]|uniref:Envelope glycoprotein UL37 n=2 Tax=Human cytomegalovirus TaxID=10359 RepID=V9LM61_HCMVM|nr:envelope glycoprotein UL37 [Human betaherpesvirus 5]WNA13243.1 envelope glycoprotein UL37 [Cytomegalovirus humanbeta5]AFR54539.1 envelope glycoprotein UL37 [Human betaherpesvirus 5]AFR55030.1 envelope glycoprotein UL37 [Human betaherpesvirus 5]AFR55367.1 envelope glycoprotein UL37 [Human betaherpesvirus 5]